LEAVQREVLTESVDVVVVIVVVVVVRKIFKTGYVNFTYSRHKVSGTKLL